MVAVGRVELDRVMVDVDARALDRRRLPGLAAVGAALDVDVDGPDPVGAIRIDEDLVVVLRAAAAIAVVGRGVAAAPELRRRRLFFFVFFTRFDFCVLSGRAWSPRRSGPRRSRRRLCQRERPARSGPASRRGACTAAAGQVPRLAFPPRPAPPPAAPRPAATIRPIRVQELPPSSDRKKPDSGRLASTRAKTVAGFLRPSIARPARPMSPVGRPLLSFVHVLPPLVVL